MVDLCGVFKRSTIQDVRDLVLQHFGPDRFHYVYHIDQADSSDRVLSGDSDNDVQFDEEFYKHLQGSLGRGSSSSNSGGGGGGSRGGSQSQTLVESLLRNIVQ